MTGTYLLKVSKYNLTIIKHISCVTFREDIGNKKCYVQLSYFLKFSFNSPSNDSEFMLLKEAPCTYDLKISVGNSENTKI
jgi:hypothetical protein